MRVCLSVIVEIDTLSDKASIVIKGGAGLNKAYGDKASEVFAKVMAQTLTNGLVGLERLRETPNRS